MEGKNAVGEFVSRTRLTLMLGQGSNSIRWTVEPAVVSEAKLSEWCQIRLRTDRPEDAQLSGGLSTNLWVRLLKELLRRG